MADTKITALTALTAADPSTDVLPIVDTSDTTMAASGTTKKISINNILACSPSATLASATISGDLTVDTSTLKVDSANDRVGIGTASPAQFVHLSKSNTSTALTAPPVGGASLRIQNSSSTNNNFGSVEFYNAAGLFGGSVNCQFTNQATPTNDLVFVTRGSSGGLEHYRIAADGVCTWSEVGGVAGTAMTLNSSGLGVGVTPSAWNSSAKAFEIGTAGNSVFSSAATFVEMTNNAYLDSVSNWVRVNTGNAAARFRTSGSGFLWLQAAAGANPITWTQAMTLDASGNVGIGVTPSAWVAGAKALQFGAYGALAQSSSGNIELSFNSYNSGAGAYKYLQTDTASLYRASSVHSWFVAPSGTAGDAITFTQAMTLDASGRLILLASTTTPATLSTNGQLTFTATSNTNLRFSYRGSDGVTRTADLTLA